MESSLETSTWSTSTVLSVSMNSFSRAAAASLPFSTDRLPRRTWYACGDGSRALTVS